MYLTATRPDIMFAVCMCSRFQSVKAVKRIFRYLKTEHKLGLWYPFDDSMHFIAYSDSDYAGCKKDRKSTTGGCQFFGNKMVTWQCKKQNTVAISTCEAEYVAAASCCSQVLWIQQQMRDYGLKFLTTPIFVDNSAAIAITENPVSHRHSKHIDIRHHFLRDCSEKQLIQLQKVDTADNVTDIFTKAFDSARFHLLVVALGTIHID